MNIQLYGRNAVIYTLLVRMIVQYNLLLRACPQELHVLLLMHPPEAHGRKMKPILTEAEVYYKPVKRYFSNASAHKFTSASHTYSKTHVHISLMYAHVFVLSTSLLMAVHMNRWEKASVPLNVVFYHITVKVSTGD